MAFRRWAPSPAALVVLAWLMLWRVAAVADVQHAAAATLLGVLVDLGLVWGAALLHRRVAASEPMALGSRLLRIGLALGVAGLGGWRAMAAAAVAVLGRDADDAYYTALHAHPEWLWGMRWLLAAALLGAPLTAWCLRHDLGRRDDGGRAALDAAPEARAEGEAPRP